MLENVPLALFSTMRLGGKARYLTHISSEADIEPALAWAQERKLRTVMIGTGANIIFTDKGFAGLVMVNDIKGIELNDTTVTAGAGEIWDDVVAKSVKVGLNGIAALSKIPGKVGAAPVQNIGAYGEEIANVLVSVKAYDSKEKKLVTIPKDECQFAYRQSRFNTEDKGRFFITSVTLQLNTDKPKPPFYRDIQKWLEDHKTAATDVTPAVIREAVTDIRYNKLPDPSRIANSGSFFYNPIIPKSQFETLAQKYPAINETPDGWTQPPRWFVDESKIKVSAAWLLQQAGFAKYEDTKAGIALWPYQNLVVTNKHAKQTADLLEFTHKIVDAVEHKFGITLQQEPEVIGD